MKSHSLAISEEFPSGAVRMRCNACSYDMIVNYSDSFINPQKIVLDSGSDDVNHFFTIATDESGSWYAGAGVS